MGRKRAKTSSKKPADVKKPAKKKTSPGSLSTAVPDEKATASMQRMIMGAIKGTGWSGAELHRNTGISLAMARRLVRGDQTDMKVSTLARLCSNKDVKLKLTAG